MRNVCLGLVLVCAAAALSGCYQASGYGTDAFNMKPAQSAYGQYGDRPSSQWVQYCKGGYDKCGRDGIKHHFDGNQN